MSDDMGDIGQQLVSATALSIVIATSIIASAHLAAADDPKLQPGLELPALEATTLNGDPAALPRDAKGHPAVIVMGFSKAATKVTRPWLDNCRTAAASKPGGSTVSCYDVRMLEDVPRSFRGMVERSMKSGYPIELQRQTLLVYIGNDAWRERVGATDAKSAYVIACDKEGRVRKLVIGPFVKAELDWLLDAVDPTPPKAG